MRKIALSLAVIAASGGYVWYEAGRPDANDMPAVGGTEQSLALPPTVPDGPPEPVRIAPAADVQSGVVQPIAPPPAPMPMPDKEPVMPAIVQVAPKPEVVIPQPATVIVATASVNRVAPAAEVTAMPEKLAPIPAPRIVRPVVSTAPEAPAKVTLAAAQQGQYVDGTYKGPAVNAFYGMVQVQVTVSRGQMTNIDVLQYPSDRRTSRYINSVALPLLESEAIQAQSGRVDAVSGATLTSNAYRKSLTAALAKAG